MLVCIYKCVCLSCVWTCTLQVCVCLVNLVIVSFALFCDLCDFVWPQSVVLEGQYWKRRVEAVAREYRKWRIYHRDKNVRNILS